MLAWQAFIRWKSLLAGSARFPDRDRFRVYRVYRVSGGSTQQDVPPLLKKYFPDVEPGRSLKDFSLEDTVWLVGRTNGICRFSEK